jgi:cation transport protein ChaC
MTIALVEKGDIWVFAYGSLMWDPGFAHKAREPAYLRGYHRAFCVGSHEYRGTPERPGLVLGLVRGGSCRGLAFRVDRRRARATLDYLEEREKPKDIYLCRRLAVVVAGRRLRAYGFVVDPSHELFTGRLPPTAVARRILDAAGERGSNRAYLADTVRHLDALGLAGTAIHAIHDAVEKLYHGRKERRGP